MSSNTTIREDLQWRTGRAACLSSRISISGTKIILDEQNKKRISDSCDFAPFGDFFIDCLTPGLTVKLLPLYDLTKVLVHCDYYRRISSLHT